MYALLVGTGVLDGPDQNAEIIPKNNIYAERTVEDAGPYYWRALFKLPDKLRFIGKIHYTQCTPLRGYPHQSANAASFPQGKP